MKSILFKSIQDIKLLNNINELNIDTIEKRAKAIQDNTSDKESWRYRSFDGFIGENETFKSRLELDWNLLDSYNKENQFNITHITISTLLKEIINQCEQTRHHLSFGPMAPIKLILNLNSLKDDNQFSFLFNINNNNQNNNNNNNNNDNNNNNNNNNDNNNNNNNSNQNDTIELYITKNIFNGFQYSLFWNDNSKSDKDKSIWNTKWNVEYTVVNIKTQKQIIISGDTQSGIIQYIEYMGFYEGDDNNQYRINPINLISLLLNQ